MTYCICYDLNSPDRDYDSLIDAIKEYGGWWHHLDSTWFIVSNDSAAEIRNNLMQHIDNNDELLVFNAGGNWAGAGFSDRAYNWLRNNI